MSVFGFPNDEDEKERWIKSLPNIHLTDKTGHIGVCERHWPLNYPRVRVKSGKYHPVNPPSLFGSPNSVFPQTHSTQSRDVTQRGVTSEARAKTSQNVAESTNAAPTNTRTWEELDSYTKIYHYFVIRPLILFPCISYMVGHLR